MSTVVALDTAKNIRAKGNTLRAMLEDTRDLLETLKYASEEDEEAAKFQIEAINDVLTSDTKPA